MAPTDRFASDLLRSVEDSIADAVARGARGAFNAVGALAAAIGEQTQSGDLQHAYENVAEAMQEAVLDAYDTNVEPLKGNEHQGRISRRSGALKPALADPSFVQATAKGIDFVNVTLLDAEAAHWRRMNFGTFGTDGAPPFSGRVTDFTINGEIIMPLGFFEGPSGPNMLPPGFFRAKNNKRVKHNTDRAGLDKFQPFGNALGVSGALPPPAMTRAIMPRSFLEQGFEGFADQMPIEFNRLIQKWLDDDRSSPTSQAFLRNLKVPGGSQRIRNFRTAASVQIRRF